jgi:hypothetical protein
MEAEPQVEEVRRFAEQRVAGSTRVRVAQEIGIAETNLRCFLAGSHPGPEPWVKLVDWYVEFRPVPELVPVDDPARLVDVLLRELEGPALNEARMRIWSALSQGYRRMGRAEPAWLLGRR